MTEKSLGQIAYEAYEASLLGRKGFATAWDKMPWQEDFEAAAQAVRRAVIEECAGIAERHREKNADDQENAQTEGAGMIYAGAALGSAAIYDEIRALLPTDTTETTIAR